MNKSYDLPNCGSVNNPLVSVIIPVYNVESYLDDCMSSVLAQTYKNLEIILVDDGATDSSGKLCDAYPERDNRVVVLHKKNGGLSDARNYGTERAHGEYIMYIDSDDRVSKKLVEVLMNSLTEANADVAICDPVHIFKPEDEIYTETRETRVFSPEEATCEMWYQSSFLPSAWAKLYKADIIRKTGFRVGILYEDIDMMHKVFYACERIVYNPSGLYGYRHREDSITTASFSLRDCEILNICDRLKSFASDKSINLQRAAKAYGVVGALRVELNAPATGEFAEYRTRARACLKADAKVVAKDPLVRRKSKIGLYLYLYCKPLMRFAYKRINRWK